MKLHADLTKRAEVLGDSLAWVESPSKGVARRMLERDGDEVARATSIVKYDPGCSFPEHTHGGGEEFLVLQGTFSDQSGEFPVGSYVRNPIGSKHAPWSKDGCILLVKLRQMTDTEEKPLRVNYSQYELDEWSPLAPGVRELSLYVAKHDAENVRVIDLQPGSKLEVQIPEGGEEIFVIEGSLEESELVDIDTQEKMTRSVTYPKWAWVRRGRDDMGEKVARSTQTGCKLWVKTGHLPLY